MPALPPLNALRAFEAAARRGSYVAAAEELNVTPAAVGQQVRHLEALTGATLFEREGRRLKLTEQGEAGLERLSRGFNLLGEASVLMRSGPPAARVALAAPAEFAATWLAPRLGGFIEGRACAVALRKASADDVDLEIALAPAPPPGAIGEALLDEIFTPAAAPSLAAGIDAPDALDGSDLIHDRSQATGWRDWFAARGPVSVDLAGGLEAGDPLTAIALAEAGLGVVLARRSLAARSMREGRLQTVFPVGDLPGPERYYLRAPGGGRLSGLAAELADWLRAQAASSVDAFDEL